MRVMKQRLATALVLTCAALFAQSVGAAQPVSIGNYGEDGDDIFYGVICDDNSEGSVIKHIEPPKQICAQPAFGAASCRGGWSVNEAAIYACQANTGNGSANSESSAATGIAGSASAHAAQPATSQRPIRVRKNSAGRPVPSTR
jgi:hypothetical protein